MIRICFLLFSLYSNTYGDEALNISFEEKYNYLRDDYETLYNTSLILYTKCASDLNMYVDLYDNERAVTDICMAKTEEYEQINTNLTNSANYTKYIHLLRENINLESENYILKNNLSENLQNFEEKKKACYSLNNELKEEVLLLKKNMSDLAHEFNRY